jgi:hypothetical protein
VLRAERSSYYYRGYRADQADLKKRMREIAETRVRYGYRRIHVLLRREGLGREREAHLSALQGDGATAAAKAA